jgi:hypothetical protein
LVTAHDHTLLVPPLTDPMNQTSHVEGLGAMERPVWVTTTRTSLPSGTRSVKRPNVRGTNLVTKGFLEPCGVYPGSLGGPQSTR